MCETKAYCACVVMIATETGKVCVIKISLFYLLVCLYDGEKGFIFFIQKIKLLKLW